MIDEALGDRGFFLQQKTHTMSINNTKIKQLSISDIWSLLKHTEAYYEVETENQRLNDDEDAKEKALHLWRVKMSFFSEFEERVRQLSI